MVVNGSCVTLKGYITDMIADDAIRFVQAHARTVRHGTSECTLRRRTPHTSVRTELLRVCTLLISSRNTRTRPSTRCPTFHSTLRTTLTAASPAASVGRTSECLKGYFAAVTAMDAAIGRVLDALKLRAS